jgi:ubiquinone/menaquinone biosynthesis C-methylase UbiE
MIATSPRYWKRHARRYDRVTLLLNRRFEAMAGHVAESIRNSRRVLEIAAGTGLVTARVAPAVGTLTATDSSPEMLAVLQARVEAEGLTNVVVEETNALALDYPDRSFDAVVIANLLHLLPEPGRALTEVQRVLGPRGLLAAPTFCHGETLMSSVVSRVLSLTGFEVVTRFAGDELRRLVSAHGFTVQSERLYPGVLPIRTVLATVALGQCS